MELEHLKDGNYIGGLTMPKEKSKYWKKQIVRKYGLPEVGYQINQVTINGISI